MIGASSGKHLSYWIDTTRRTDYPALPGDVLTSEDVSLSVLTCRVVLVRRR